MTITQRPLIQLYFVTPPPPPPEGKPCKHVIQPVGEKHLVDICEVSVLYRDIAKTSKFCHIQKARDMTMRHTRLTLAWICLFLKKFSCVMRPHVISRLPLWSAKSLRWSPFTVVLPILNIILRVIPRHSF